MSTDIKNIREHCLTCNRNAPSQSPIFTPNSPVATTPFEKIFADFFEFRGNHYLLIGDRFSGWVEIFSSASKTEAAGSSGLQTALRSVFRTFGVPEELSSDGGPEFSSQSTREFLRKWGVQHRMSSAYFPQSNGRAEVAVKKVKRLLGDNVEMNGSLDNDRLLRGLFQIRNTPDSVHEL